MTSFSIQDLDIPNICQKYHLFCNGRNVIRGLQLHQGFLHRKVDTNTFETMETPIPKEYHKSRKSHYFQELCLRDFKKQRLTKPLNNPSNNSLLVKSYTTHDNGGHAFLVNIMKNEDVEIFKQDSENYYVLDSDYAANDDDNSWIFNKFVKKYQPIQTFIGKSLKNEMTLFSGGHGSQLDGNSILLQIGINKYAHIGERIYDFKTNEPILEYYSPVGNSDVPYPYGISQNFFYDFLDKIYISLDKFPKLTKTLKLNMISYYYDNIKDLKLHTKKLKNYKLICKRDGFND